MKMMTNTLLVKAARKSVNASERRKPDWMWICELSNHLADEAVESVEEVDVAVEENEVEVVAAAMAIADVATANSVVAATVAIAAIAVTVTPAPLMFRTKPPSPVSVAHSLSSHSCAFDLLSPPFIPRLGTPNAAEHSGGKNQKPTS